MKFKQKVFFIIISLIIVIFVSCYFYQKYKQKTYNENSKATFSDYTIITNSETPTKIDGQAQVPTQIANPASLNCSKLGGNLIIQKRGDGGEYGVCFFEDNRQCEEWALLRGDCPVGGLKITGYENKAEIFCVITGGKIEGLGTESPLCKRTDGTFCAAQANFNGECPDQNDPNPNAGNVETK